MATKQAKELIKWLEENYPGRKLTLEEVKDLFDIEHTPEPGVYGAWAENLTYGMIEEMEKELKASGEYDILENKIQDFKDKIAGIYKPGTTTKPSI